MQKTAAVLVCGFVVLNYLSRGNTARLRRISVSMCRYFSADMLKPAQRLIQLLNKSDILNTNRGYQGGYKLAKAPSKYTVGEILRLTEGSLSPVSCLDHDPIECERSADCITLPIWQGLKKAICDYLDGITLQDILDMQREKYMNDYVI